MIAALIILINEIALLGVMVLMTLVKGVPFSFKEFAPITGILIAATLAVISLFYTINRNQSSDYLEKSLQFFKESFDIIYDLDEHGIPKNNRLNWLTASRLLLTAQKLGTRITEPAHKEIFLESREYWRAKFYALLNPSNEGFPEDYYAEKVKHMACSYSAYDREPLAEKSLAIMYRFLKWPSDYQDPAYDVTNFTDDEIDKMVTFGPRGLGNLLQKVRSYKFNEDA